MERGQLIFVGGGWVMGDEALPSYQHMLMNYDTGLTFLFEEFNYRPSIGW